MLGVKQAGKWFVLEGPKGCGKTAAQQQISRENPPGIVYAAEPSPMPTGQIARKLAAEGAEDVAVFRAMCDDRVASMKEVRKQQLHGNHVLQSRSYCSTAVLQGALGRIDSPLTMSRIMSTHMDAWGCPAIMFWFDGPEGVSVEELAAILLDRVAARGDSQNYKQLVGIERQIMAYRDARKRYESTSKLWCAFRTLPVPLSVGLNCLLPLTDVTMQIVEAIARVTRE